MGNILSYEDVKRQSEAVFGQFGESKWMPYTKMNMTLTNRRDPEELAGCGLGKVALLAAMGESLEGHIETIKKHREKFDLVTCDKGFALLMERGIKPDFVQLCDCNISYKWLEPYVDETKDVKLVATCYANVEWTTKWRGPIYFYANKDALHTEGKFIQLMGEFKSFEAEFLNIPSKKVRVIPAGSNVSNAMLIFLVGIDEENRQNWAGYEHYLLTGYDYSWRPYGLEAKCKTGSYYAFNDPKPKRFYMQHRTMLDFNGDYIHTSENLLFSAKWMYSYVTAYNLPVTNCSERGILDIPRKRKLDELLSKLKVSKSATSRLKEQYEICKSAMTTFVVSQDSLNASRRALWQ